MDGSLPFVFRIDAINMKRFLLSLGFLLLPLSANAQSALSPWVQGVLERADQGISTAGGRPASTVCDEKTKASEYENNLSFAREHLTAVLRLEVEMWQLRERTVCYESDRVKMLKKLNELQEQLKDATDRCSFDGAAVLRSTYAFTLGAYESFLRGGANPSYSDNRLRYTYPFQDDESWTSLSEPRFEEGSSEPLCAFSSDFAPHAIGYKPAEPGAAVTDFEKKSYGCDSDVLSVISLPLDQEAQTFKDFLDETDTFARTVYDTVQRALNSLNTFLAFYNNTLPPDANPPVSLPKPPHAVVHGCLRPYIPDPASASPQEWEDLLATYPEYFDLWKSAVDADGTITFRPEPDDILPVGMLFQPVTDFFRMDPMAMILLRNYIDRRGDAGFQRPLPVHMTTRALDSYLSVFQAADSQNDMRFISVNNEQSMAYMEAISRDGYERMQDAAGPLHEAVEKLIYVTKEYLPKEYVPQLTFFLARSCVNGHCQSTLDTVTKRIFNPYCTPYLDALYKEEDAHKKCFCDPSVRATWGDFDKYCSSDFSSEMSKYDGMEQKLFPGCMEDGFEEQPTP